MRRRGRPAKRGRDEDPLIWLFRPTSGRPSSSGVDHRLRRSPTPSAAYRIATSSPSFSYATWRDPVRPRRGGGVRGPGRGRRKTSSLSASSKMRTTRAFPTAGGPPPLTWTSSARASARARPRVPSPSASRSGASSADAFRARASELNTTIGGAHETPATGGERSHNRRRRARSRREPGIRRRSCRPPIAGRLACSISVARRSLPPTTAPCTRHLSSVVPASERSRVFENSVSSVCRSAQRALHLFGRMLEARPWRLP